MGAADRLVVYEWPEFSVTFDTISGEVTTYYDYWRYSRVAPDETDELHGGNLGFSAAEHKLVHELAHHLLGVYFGYGTSPIIYRAAHMMEQPEKEWRDEERGVNALVYSAFGVDLREEDQPSLEWLKEHANLELLQRELVFLWMASRTPSTNRPKIRLAKG